MRVHIALLVIGALAVALTAGAAAARYAVDKEHQDDKQVYYGSLDRFDKPAEVALRDVVQMAPEYERIQRENIRRGTGEYWILMERASQRALRAVNVYGRESDYDLITASGYLGGVDASIPATDVTEDVIETMLDD